MADTASGSGDKSVQVKLVLLGETKFSSWYLVERYRLKVSLEELRFRPQSYFNILAERHVVCATR